MTLTLILARALVLSFVIWAVLPLFRKARASVRRALIVTGFLACLLGPVITALLPTPSASSALAIDTSRMPFAEPAEAAQEARAASLSSETSAPTVVSFEEGLVAVWAAFALVFLMRTAALEWRALGLARRAVHHADDVWLSAELDVPAVAGALRPRVLLPHAALSWSEAQREAALVHERAHVARRDGLALLCARLCCALYWPVPLMFVLARRLHRECELAADERVVEAGIDAADYAGTLLNVARGARTHQALSFSLISELEERIRALCAVPHARWSRLRESSAFLPVLALAVALACAREVGATPAHASARPAKDPRVQRIVDAEVKKAKADWQTDDVVVAVLDARDGRLVSHAGDIDRPRLPGSTVKPFTVATALEAGKVRPDQTFDIAGGKRQYGKDVLEDAAPNTTLSLAEVLMVSSNVGSSRVFDLLGGEALLAGQRKFHLGDAAGLPASVATGSLAGAMQAGGEGSPLTALELAAGYASFVDGTYRDPITGKGERVIRAETAKLVRDMLVRAVHDPRGTGGNAAIARVKVAGKTGTTWVSAQEPERMFASFVGLVPAEAPRFVIYVGVTTQAKDVTGGKAAAPVFARIAARALSP